MNTPLPTNKDPKYSIVVITTVRSSLYDLLRSLDGVDGIERAEIILVSQEKDGTLNLPLMSSLPLNIISVEHPWGRPYGFYRNEGVRRARGDVVLFLDDDVMVTGRGWLSAITAPIASGAAEAVMGRVVVEKSNFLGDTIALLGYPAGANLGFEKMWHVDRRGYTRHLSTCNAAVLRSALLDIGGFEEHGSSGEDNVLADRLTGRRYRIRYESRAVVRHAARSTLRGFVRWHADRGKSHYFVGHALNEGLYALRLKSYARLMIHELPFRASLILFLLSVSVFSQAWGYFGQARISRRMHRRHPSWKILSPIPDRRRECAYVRSENRFYLVGGLEKGKELPVPTRIYNPASGVWTEGAAPPVLFHHCQAVAVRGLIYVTSAWTTPGARNARANEKVFIYDPGNDLWISGPEVPADRRRGSAGVAVYRGRIYIVGGNVGGHGRNSRAVPWFDEFDPATGAWKRLADAPRPRDHFQAVVAGDRLYAAAGRDSGISYPWEGNTVPEIDVYDFAPGRWRNRRDGLPPDIPTPRAGAAAVACSGTVMIIGGESRRRSAHRENEGLDIKTGRWLALPPLPNGVHGAQGILHNGAVYIAGGSSLRGMGRGVQRQQVFFIERWFSGNRPCS